MARETDLKNTDFQSEKAGSIIKSKRKFGVELEVLATSRNSYETLINQISTAYGIHHDGSIEGSGMGIEIVTPIMSGVKGENEIKKLLANMVSLGFTTNKSCGFHVHHDGTQFLSPKTTEIRCKPMYDLYDRTPEEYRNTIADKKFFSLQNRLYSMLLGKGFSMEDIYNAFLKSYTTKGGKERVDVSIKNHIYKVNRLSTHFYLNNITVATDDIWFETAKDDVTSLKNILYAYTVFDDVFQMLVPSDRREANRFCKKLSTRIAPYEIQQCKTMEDLETLWYRAKTKTAINTKKNTKYDESRYYLANFHSLFAKYNTIEIRLHEGTLNEKVVLYWIAIHQHIIDRLSNGYNAIGVMEQACDMFDRDEKLKFFLRFFKFSKELENYIIHRAEFFKTN